MARRSRGDDARRKATLDIDDDDDDDKDGLVDGLEAILAPPRRASAEECMSRASDWKEWNVTTTRACLSRVHRREEGLDAFFFFFYGEAARSEREGEGERAFSSLALFSDALRLSFSSCSGSLARQQQRATAAGRSPFSSREGTHASSPDRSSSSSSSSSAAEPPSWSQVSKEEQGREHRSERGIDQSGPAIEH